MNYCEHCGAKLNDGAIFCGNCGVKITPVAQNKRAEHSNTETIITSNPTTSESVQSSRKKSHFKIFLIAGIPIVVVVLILLFFWGNKATSNNVVGVWVGTYEYNNAQHETILIVNNDGFYEEYRFTDGNLDQTWNYMWAILDNKMVCIRDGYFENGSAMSGEVYRYTYHFGKLRYNAIDGYRTLKKVKNLDQAMAFIEDSL